KWYTITARSSAQPGQPAIVPDPPSYARCVAALRDAAARARSRARTTDAQYRSQCSSEATQIRQQTLALLIQADWLAGEAKRLGVTVTDRDLQTQLATTRRQAFPTTRAWNQFLRTSGMSEADVLFRLRVQTLSTRIGQRIQNEAAPVTSAA